MAGLSRGVLANVLRTFGPGNILCHDKSTQLIYSTNQYVSLGSKSNHNRCFVNMTHVNNTCPTLIVHNCSLNSSTDFGTESSGGVKLSLPRKFNRPYVTSNETQECWKCGREINCVKEQFFCDCGMIQPPQNRNYFEVFGIVESYDIDVNSLQQRFRNLQWNLHPDKFSRKEKIEQDHAQEQSTLVNQAYKTLQKALPRGLYILQLHGYVMDEGDIELDPGFLMNIMELNEDVAEADSRDFLVKIKEEMREIIDDLNIDISKAFKKKDFALAREILARLQYYANVEDKAANALESFEK